MASYFFNYIQELCKGIAVFILLIVLFVHRMSSPLKKCPQTFKSSVQHPNKSSQRDVVAVPDTSVTGCFSSVGVSDCASDSVITQACSDTGI